MWILQAKPMLNVTVLTLGRQHRAAEGILWGCAGSGLQWWSSLKNRFFGSQPWVLQDMRVTGATSTSKQNLCP